jgi:hypothetical protein
MILENDRPVYSLERAPLIDKSVGVQQELKFVNNKMAWPTVGRKMTLTCTRNLNEITVVRQVMDFHNP